MGFFKELPQFGSDESNDSAPTSAQRDDGWTSSDVPESAIFNYLHRTLYLTQLSTAERLVRAGVSSLTSINAAGAFSDTFYDVIRHPSSEGFLAVGTNGEVHTINKNTGTYNSNTSQEATGGSNDLFGVAYSDSLSLYCAVGETGYIETTGTVWTGVSTPSSGTSENLQDVTWASNAGLFVAVGGAGTIITSPDGSTWTSQTSGTAENLNAVFYEENSGVILAVGVNGTALYSINGTTWFLGDAKTAAGFCAMYSPTAGRFIIGTNTDEIYYGRGHTSFQTSDPNTNSGATVVRGVTYINGVLVAAVSGTERALTTSVDGITWTQAFVETSSDQFMAIANNGEVVCLVGENGTVRVSDSRLL